MPRQAPERHKERIVSERQFDTLKLIGEEVAEFEYRPVACKKATGWSCSARSWWSRRGSCGCSSRDRYFFYITNDRTTPASEIVFLANDRCDQENLIAQLKGGREGAGDAGGRPGEQLGVHGDGQPGLEPEGVERLGAAGVAAAAEKYRAEKRSLLRMEFARSAWR